MLYLLSEEKNSYFKRFVLFLCACVFIFSLAHSLSCSLSSLLCVHRYSWNSEEGIRLPPAGLTDICEPPDMAAGNRTLVLCNSGTHS